MVLTSGARMPVVGLGCWKIQREECKDVVYKAIRMGYRCIDEAAKYHNEVEAG